MATIEQQAVPLAYIDADGITLAERDDGALVLILTREDGASLGLPLLHGVLGALRVALDAADQVALPHGGMVH